MLTRRSFVKNGLICAAAASLPSPHAVAAALDRTLYNGIVLPAAWPPRYAGGRQPDVPPYLQKRPDEIPIDIGRQLFVDDFLIESSTLERRHHSPAVHPASPVLRPDRDWEIDREGGNPSAMPYSDGVLWDPADRLFKMWYMVRYGAATAYATSSDGLHWTKPSLDVVRGTNIVLTSSRDSNTVWLDERDTHGQRFKMASSQSGGATTQVKYVSPDGIRWTSLGPGGPAADRSTMFFNPFLGRWVFSLRAGMGTGGDPRRRQYLEADDFDRARWTAADPVDWISTDDRDSWRADFKLRPQLYNLDCVAYESVLLGLFSIWRGESSTHHKHNDICVGFSRDGFHWSRPDRRPFVGPEDNADSDGSWRRSNVQSAGGCCLVVGSNLYFYFSARSGRRGSGSAGTGSTGLAVLRRDGFVSMGTDKGGTLTTRPIRFGGRELFVNAVCRELRVEVLDREGRSVDGLGRDECQPFQGDSTAARLAWRGGAGLARVAGTAVRLRFHLTGGELFAFWVAPDERGASRGYLANGSPGSTGVLDTTGGKA
jgi:hypothetical protein